MAFKNIILLVEDSSDDEMFFMEALQELKITSPILVARNGEEALEIIRTTKDDFLAIFSDMNMPKMNGLELKRAIETDPLLKIKAIPFIFFSTAASQKEVIEAYDLGVQGYFNKPNSFQELIENLDIIIKYWSRCRHPKNVF
jgi:CheY-like chemotaxis protein